MISRTSLVVLVLLAGCVDVDGVDDEAAVFSDALTSADSANVLTLVNASSTTFALLDGDIGLDARAARGIVDGRPFATLAALDAVPYVGDVALGKLLDYANAHAPTTLAGVFDGVAFDEPTAQRALQIANTSSKDDLVAHGMYATGANKIAAARPYTTLAQVAALDGVGSATMGALRAYAASTTGCTLTLARRADTTVERFDELLALATTLDYPAAATTALQVAPCNDPELIAEALRTTPLIDTGYDSSVHPSVSVRSGGSAFVSYVNVARETIVDRNWTPTTAAEQQLLNDLPSMVTALTADAAANPSKYREFVLRIPAEECTSEGSALMDRTSGKIWVIWQYPRC